METRYIIQFVNKEGISVPVITETEELAENYVREFISLFNYEHRYYPKNIRAGNLAAEVLYEGGEFLEIEIKEVIYLTERRR